MQAVSLSKHLQNDWFDGQFLHADNLFPQKLRDPW